MGNGEVFFETIGLDENLHAELEEGQRCRGGMEHCGGLEEGAEESCRHGEA